MHTDSRIPAAALRGVRVIEMGQLIAGPFAGKTLADFGADVIKIEPPGGGDPLRNWRLLEGRHLGLVAGAVAQQEIVALDLRKPRRPGHRAQADRRSRRADRELPPRHAGRLGPGLGGAVAAEPAAWSCCASPATARPARYRDLPGFGVVGEAMGGLRHLTGEPGRVPVRCGV